MHQIGSSRFLITVYALILIYSHSTAQKLPLFENGNTVVYIGDSITHGGAYHAFVQLFCATQFPDHKVNYFNCGISGDDTEGTLARLDSDIFVHKPDYAFIMLGMNDIRHWMYSKEKADEARIKLREETLRIYYDKTEKLAAILVEKGVKPIFMTPSIYDQTADVERENHFGANDALIKCGNHIRGLAKKHNAPLVDLNTIMLQVNEKIQVENKTATIIGHDRVHPGDEGHLVMAYEIIKTVLPTEYVSNLVLDASRKKIITAENCKVKLNGGAEKFTVLAEALPFPVRENLRATQQLIPYYGNFNKEMVTVQNLQKGTYELHIDEVSVGKYTSEELGKGINLSGNTKTPQYKQAEKISELCFSYRRVQGKLRIIPFVETRLLKGYEGPNTLEGKRKFLDEKNKESEGKSWYHYHLKSCKTYFEVVPKEAALWKKLDSIRTVIYTKNKPKKHTYKLVRI